MGIAVQAERSSAAARGHLLAYPESNRLVEPKFRSRIVPLSEVPGVPARALTTLAKLVGGRARRPLAPPNYPNY